MKNYLIETKEIINIIGTKEYTIEVTDIKKKKASKYTIFRLVQTTKSFTLSDIQTYSKNQKKSICQTNNIIYRIYRFER